MTDAYAYCKAWERNRNRARAYETSFQDNDPAWAIVFRFYAALHLTQGYLVTKSKRFDAKSHGERKKAIKDSPELRGRFRESFEDLQDLSENVRYDPLFSPTVGDYKAAETYLGVSKLKTHLPK